MSVYGKGISKAMYCSKKDLMAQEAQYLLGSSNQKMHAGKNEDDVRRIKASQIKNLHQEQRMVSLYATDLGQSCLHPSYPKHTAH